jgi:membrane associated rhomboid family serine protease
MPSLPPITQALLLINVAVYCLDLFIGPGFTQLFALWPIGHGFLPWQIGSYAFLHGGIAHLFVNMLGLWMFGPELERVWGPKRYAYFYGASVLSAAAAQMVVAVVAGSMGPTLGASGGVIGLLMGYALVFPRRQFDLVGFLPMVLLMIPGQLFYILGIVLFTLLMTNRQAVPIPPIPIAALTMVLIYGAVELISGVMGTQAGVAHFAHLGGMLGGYLMIRYWRGQPPFGRR